MIKAPEQSPGHAAGRFVVVGLELYYPFARADKNGATAQAATLLQTTTNRASGFPD